MKKKVNYEISTKMLCMTCCYLEIPFHCPAFKNKKMGAALCTLHGFTVESGGGCDDYLPGKETSLKVYTYSANGNIKKYEVKG